MATNYKNTKFYIQSTLNTVPASASGTGTITTTGKSVVGAGTLFLTEMPVGSWLCSLTAGEVRKVMNVMSDTEALLDHGFTVDLGAGSTAHIITAINANVKEISVTNAGGGIATVDGESLPANVYFTFSKANRHDSTKDDFIDPITLDGTVSNCAVFITKN